jgi:cytochrome c553
VRRIFISTGFVLLAAFALAPPLHAETANGDATRGRFLSKAEQCQECHGETGLGTAEHYPKLAGQSAAYIRKQLGDFHAGARKSEIMNAMAANLSPQDMADIAAWFSSAPPWSGEQHNFSATGQTIFLDGDVFRTLPSCASCHGEKGAGSDQGPNPVPAIGGQHESYLANQLHAWKADDRKNSPGDVMNDIAHRLSEAEVDALARYLSGLRAME